jgi:hypothetical protein
MQWLTFKRHSTKLAWSHTSNSRWQQCGTSLQEQYNKQYIPDDTSRGIHLNFVNVIRYNSVTPEPEGSSPYSQEHATGSYPEPNEPIPSQRFNLIPTSNMLLCLPSVLFPSGLPAKTVYIFLDSPMHAIWSAHLILLDLIYLVICNWL